MHCVYVLEIEKKNYIWCKGKEYFGFTDGNSITTYHTLLFSQNGHPVIFYRWKDVRMREKKERERGRDRERDTHTEWEREGEREIGRKRGENVEIERD